MFNAFSIEWLKTKRTIIRKLIWILPILVVIITTVFFGSTGYVVQSIINQWSLIWINLFLALIIGLIDRHEKNSTNYKMLLSSPTDLFQYELGRILHGVVLSLLTTVMMIILIFITSCLMPTKVTVAACIFALLGIFLAMLWEIPLYTWLSRVTNLYVSITVAFAGTILGMWLNTFSFGKIFPFTWSALMPVSLIRMHVNGLVVKSNEIVPNSNWTMLASIILFIILSCCVAVSFKKQVTKHA